VRLAPEVVGVQESGKSLPSDISLLQNYPNPFNSQTVIEVDIESDMKNASLSIYDIGGQLVSTLFDGAILAGEHRFAWHGRNASGNKVPSGLYFYQLRAGERRLNRKMVLIK
jgi:flagellar hook assembly protein FlgD